MSDAQQQARDEHWMRQALAHAELARAAGEVPVGAVLVRGDELIATGRNAPLAGCDPTAHAEVQALRAAGARLGNYRLDGCTLYVTLEPCAMCAGAMLHARLSRVVFGAADPKTGAAGSVLDLFAEPRLNHQTELRGGVLADECAAPLAEFFRTRRQAQKAAHPLREDALRTPLTRFADLAPLPWPSLYLSDLPALAGLRLHCVDTAPGSAGAAWLLVHGPDTWSHDLRHLIGAFAELGQRVVAPDLIGFGRSDKPKKEAPHTPQWHAQILVELVRRLQLPHVVLIAQQAPWALALAALLPERIAGVLRIDDAPAQRSQAPYPDKGHLAGPRAQQRWSMGAGLPPAGLPHASLRELGVRGAVLDSTAQALALARAALPYFLPSSPPFPPMEQAPRA